MGPKEGSNVFPDTLVPRRDISTSRLLEHHYCIPDAGAESGEYNDATDSPSKHQLCTGIRFSRNRRSATECPSLSDRPAG